MSWDSRERAEEFMRSDSLREAMQKGGVISEPRATWLEEQETCTYSSRRGARSRPPRPDRQGAVT